MKGAAVAVYRIFDPARILLYVGTSQDPQKRITWHQAFAIFRSQIDEWTAEWFGSRAEAEAAEAAAISAEFPRWNVQGRSPLHPDGGRLSVRQIARRYPHDVSRPCSSYWARDYDRRIAPALRSSTDRGESADIGEAVDLPSGGADCSPP